MRAALSDFADFCWTNILPDGATLTLLRLYALGHKFTYMLPSSPASRAEYSMTSPLPRHGGCCHPDHASLGIIEARLLLAGFDIMP